LFSFVLLSCSFLILYFCDAKKCSLILIDDRMPQTGEGSFYQIAHAWMKHDQQGSFDLLCSHIVYVTPVGQSYRPDEKKQRLILKAVGSETFALMLVRAYDIDLGLDTEGLDRNNDGDFGPGDSLNIYTHGVYAQNPKVPVTAGAFYPTDLGNALQRWGYKGFTYVYLYICGLAQDMSFAENVQRGTGARFVLSFLGPVGVTMVDNVVISNKPPPPPVPGQNVPPPPPVYKKTGEKCVVLASSAQCVDYPWPAELVEGDTFSSAKFCQTVCDRSCESASKEKRNKNELRKCYRVNRLKIKTKGGPDRETRNRNFEVDGVGVTVTKKSKVDIRRGLSEDYTFNPNI